MTSEHDGQFAPVSLASKSTIPRDPTTTTAWKLGVTSEHFEQFAPGSLASKSTIPRYPSTAAAGIAPSECPAPSAIDDTRLSELIGTHPGCFSSSFYAELKGGRCSLGAVVLTQGGRLGGLPLALHEAIGRLLVHPPCQDINLRRHPTSSGKDELCYREADEQDNVLRS